jgi:hypothetical protein
MTHSAGPDDFRVRYEWHEGSMPPPHHYEYVIEVGPGLEGMILFMPDYPFEAVPRWTERFHISEEEHRELYSYITHRKLMRARWQRESHPSVGGSLSWCRIEAGGEICEIPSGLGGKSEEEAEKLYTRIRDLVPPELWSGLMLRREEYVQNYGK